MGAPAWIPASHWLQQITLASVDTTSAVYSLSAGQLSSVMDGGDFYLRARGQAKNDAHVTDCLSDFYAFAATTPAGEISLRYVHSTHSWMMKVRGVDLSSVLADTSQNVLMWGIGDECVFHFWYKPSTGKLGFRIDVNGVCADGWVSFNLPGPNYPDFTYWPQSGAIVSGQQIHPMASPYWTMTAGGAGTTGAVEPTWNLAEGATTSDNGITWTCSRTMTTGGALPTPTALNLGGDASGNNRLPFIWDQLWFGHTGTSHQIINPSVVFIGDSVLTSYQNRVSAASRCRTVTQARSGGTWVMLGHPGHYVICQDTSFGLSRYAVDPGILAVVVQVGVNEVNGGNLSAATTAYQTMVTHINSYVPNAKLLLCPMAPARGAANVTAHYTDTFVPLNANIAGTGTTPITGTITQRLGPYTNMDNGSGYLAAACDSGDAIHPNAYGATVNGGYIQAALVANGIT